MGSTQGEDDSVEIVDVEDGEILEEEGSDITSGEEGGRKRQRRKEGDDGATGGEQNLAEEGRRRQALVEIVGARWAKVIRPARSSNRATLYGGGGVEKIRQGWAEIPGNPLPGTKPGKRERGERRGQKAKQEEYRARKEMMEKRKEMGQGLGAPRQIARAAAHALAMQDLDKGLPVEVFPKWRGQGRKRSMEREEHLSGEWDQQASASRLVRLTTQIGEVERLILLYTHLLAWCAVPRDELRRHYDEQGERKQAWVRSKEGWARTAAAKSRRRRNREIDEGSDSEENREAQLLPPLNKEVLKGL